MGDWIEEALTVMVDEALICCLSVGFARVMLRGPDEKLIVVLPQALLLGLLAWFSTTRILHQHEDIEWLHKNYSALCGCEVLLMLLGRGMRVELAVAAAAVAGAVAASGDVLLGLRLVVVCAGCLVARKSTSSRRILALCAACAFAAVLPFIARQILPIEDFAKAYASMARLHAASNGEAELARKTLILVVTGIHAQLAVGASGVSYLRAAQRRKNALLKVDPNTKGSAKNFARREAWPFIILAAVPYLIERTSMEAMYELAYRRYASGLQRTLRLEGVLGVGSGFSALDAVGRVPGGLTLESHGRALESAAHQVYTLASRKVFSLPKLALVPSILAAHPGPALAALPFFLLVDSLKARLVARLSSEIERRRRLTTEIESRRGMVETHDVARSASIAAVQAEKWNARQWSELSTAIERELKVKTALETLRRYIRWLYWADFLTPSIELAMAFLIENRLIGLDDIWVTARAFEDAIDLILTKSRAESELTELAGDVKRLDSLSDALEASRARVTPEVCRQQGDELALSNILYSRGTTRVEGREVTAAKGERLAVTGPNGSGKSSLFAVLQACAAQRPLPSSIEIIDAPPCDDEVCRASYVTVPLGSVVHVAQRPYCPLHARPIDWLRFSTTTTAPLEEEARDLEHVVTLMESLRFHATTNGAVVAFNVTSLLEVQEDFCGTLSGGQQVKLDLIRQVLLPAALKKTNIGLLLLDEIFSPLDPTSRVLLQDAIVKACPDSLVLTIYHHSDDDCVPDAGFFTSTLHFLPPPASSAAFQITRRPTCPT